MISDACPLILPTHVALDISREKSKGSAKIGTTGRGIGPAYEDKVGRRSIRVSDLKDLEKLEFKLREVIEYHNFLLQDYFKSDGFDFTEVFDLVKLWAQELLPLIVDSTELIHAARDDDETFYLRAHRVLCWILITGPILL